MARGVAIKGKRYKEAVLKVLERDAKGRPSKCEVLYDESVTKLVGGEHFWIIFANVEMTIGKKDLH